MWVEMMLPYMGSWGTDVKAITVEAVLREAEAWGK